MKKYLYLIAAALLIITLVSCQSAEESRQTEPKKAADVAQKADGNAKNAKNVSADQYDGKYILPGGDSGSSFSTSDDYIVIENGEFSDASDNYYYIEYLVEQGKLYKRNKNNDREPIVYSFVGDSLVEYEEGTDKVKWEYVKEGGKSLWAYELETQTSDLNLPIEVKGNTVARVSASSFVPSVYISETNELNGLTDVKSVWSKDNDTTTFLIRNNGELWGYGRNTDGRLGDGTGVDREESVKILDNVAMVYIPDNARQFGVLEYVFAITNDKTLWRWGAGIYAPEKWLDGIVAVKGANLFLTQSGELITYSNDSFGTNSFRGIDITEPVVILKNVKDADAIYSGFGSTLICVLHQDNSIEIFTNASSGGWNNNSTYNSIVIDNAPNSIEKILSFTYTGAWGSIIVALENGECWGMGKNDKGQLGDGTKIDRDEFVKIMDNTVQYAANNGTYRLLQTNGTLWEWTQDNPTPAICDENVAWLGEDAVSWLTNDGELWHESIGKKRIVAEGVKVPD